LSKLTIAGFQFLAQAGNILQYLLQSQLIHPLFAGHGKQVMMLSFQDLDQF